MDLVDERVFNHMKWLKGRRQSPGGLVVGQQLVQTRLDCKNRIMQSADLEQAQLRSLLAHLSEWRNSVFIDADLSNAKFVQARLEKCTLSGAILPHATFTSAGLSGVSMVGIKARKAVFSRAHLDKINFTAAELPAATFRWASLRGCEFAQALLAGVDFSHSLLDHIDFRRADLRDANFDSAILASCKFEGCVLPNGRTFEDVASEAIMLAVQPAMPHDASSKRFLQLED